MLATIVDVFSQFIDYRIYQRERERDACFTRLWLTPAAKQGLMLILNAKLHEYLQFQLSPSLDEMWRKQSKVGNIMTLKFTVQPSYNQMGI